MRPAGAPRVADGLADILQYGKPARIMKAQSLVFAIVGAFFGFLVGWILGTQRAPSAVGAAASPAAAVQQTAAAPAKTVDENLVAGLRADIQREPGNARPRIDLGNLYYDAERFDEASKWYEEALKLDVRNTDVSTDLGICYYYLNQADRALQQFDYSLKIDPKHTKTWLNQGVVRAFGKQDLKGAASSWQKVIDLAPNSQEAQAAKRMLDGIKSGHPEVGGPASTPQS
jgi:cytochrome c-type biogenesis protein CcmH/NrfG